MRFFCLLFSLLSIQSISYFILSPFCFHITWKNANIYNIYSIWSVLCFLGHIGMTVLRIYGLAKNSVIDLLNIDLYLLRTARLSLCQLVRDEQQHDRNIFSLTASQHNPYFIQIWFFLCTWRGTGMRMSRWLVRRIKERVCALSEVAVVGCNLVIPP